MEPLTIAGLQEQFPTVSKLQASHPHIDIVKMLRNPFPPDGRTPEANLWHQLGPIARMELRAQLKERA